MKRKINLIIAIFCVAIAALFYIRMGLPDGWPWIAGAVVIGLIHLFLPSDSERQKSEKEMVLFSEEVPTELILLNEEDGRIASWNIYGKNGVVIGRDVGENQVNVNLDQAVYASMIDIEHAVLNYSGNNWYIEDISSQNGVSVQKRDGKKYKISYGKPCRLERGDIIHIGLTRLKLM
ncbi:MAG: FHA domain-containing protein [Lachnospiraceae bacterium]|nr:FHA domain-containing protein [Lachnospiraceae bacterium]